MPIRVSIPFTGLNGVLTYWGARLVSVNDSHQSDCVCFVKRRGCFVVGAVIGAPCSSSLRGAAREGAGPDVRLVLVEVFDENDS